MKRTRIELLTQKALFYYSFKLYFVERIAYECFEMFISRSQDKNIFMSEKFALISKREINYMRDNLYAVQTFYFPPLT